MSIAAFWRTRRAHGAFIACLALGASANAPGAALANAPVPVPVPAAAPAPPRVAVAPALASRIDDVVSEWLSSTDAPSVSIAIVQGGALVYARAYGHARLRPASAAQPDSRYAIDSLTKEFTAAAILLLAEHGKVSLEDPIGKWIPDLGAAAPVTVRQLLSHTGGVRDYWPQDFVTPEMTKPTTPSAIIDSWVKRPLDFIPGSDWQYSNTGYVLAAEVVERAAGQVYFDYLQRNLFMPLHMTQVADYAVPGRPGDAAGYTRHGLGPVRAAAKESPGWLFGAANLAMRPSDLALWDISMIDRSFLSARSYAAEFEPVVLKDGGAIPYGLGLDIEHVQGRLRIGHSGGGSGFLADNRIWPDERAAIVVLTNNDWAPPSDLSERLAFLILAPSPVEARARTVFESLQNGSIDRTLFTPTGNFYLDDAALDDLRNSLKGLGPLRSLELEQESKRGGMITRHWKILCRSARLEAVERGYDGGKLEEFLITAHGD